MIKERRTERELLTAPDEYDMPNNMSYIVREAVDSLLGDLWQWQREAGAKAGMRPGWHFPGAAFQGR